LTNGAIFAKGEVDFRTRLGRRYRDIVSDVLYELNYPKDLLVMWYVKQLAAMVVILEQAQKAITLGQEVNTDEFVRLSGAVRRHRQFLHLGPAKNALPVLREKSFEESIGGFTKLPDKK
jgi:hypothetical protein